jgi:hypothetical protein
VERKSEKTDWPSDSAEKLNFVASKPHAKSVIIGFNFEVPTGSRGFLFFCLHI